MKWHNYILWYVISISFDILSFFLLHIPITVHLMISTTLEWLILVYIMVRFFDYDQKILGWYNRIRGKCIKK